MDDGRGGAARWRKSSRSGDTECVEVAVGARYVRVRDSMVRDGPVLVFTRREWAAFVKAVRSRSL